MTWRRKTGLGGIVLVACIAGVLLVGLLASAAGHCSFFRGECRYDPRTQRPSALFIAQAPEPYVVQYIRDQIGLNGTFPSTAGSTVKDITPVLVTAGGFYTDWHVGAEVNIRIDYADASSREVTFETMEKTASTVLGIENTTMRVGFGALKECDNPSVGHWVCR